MSEYDKKRRRQDVVVTVPGERHKRYKFFLLGVVGGTKARPYVGLLVGGGMTIGEHYMTSINPRVIQGCFLQFLLCKIWIRRPWVHKLSAVERSRNIDALNVN